MRHALELERELGRHGLVLILSEVQGHGLEEVEAFMLRRWPEARARVTTGFRVPGVRTRGIPATALCWWPATRWRSPAGSNS